MSLANLLYDTKVADLEHVEKGRLFSFVGDSDHDIFLKVEDDSAIRIKDVQYIKPTVFVGRTKNIKVLLYPKLEDVFTHYSN